MIRDYNAGLTLDGLAHEGAHVGVGQGLGQGLYFVERYALESDEKSLSISGNPFHETVHQ